MISDMITKAISEKKIVEFDYNGHHRIAEPHVYGILKNEETILIFQTGGTSSSETSSSWRTMHTDKIMDFKITGDFFDGKRDTPTGKHTPFSSIFIMVK